VLPLQAALAVCEGEKEQLGRKVNMAAIKEYGAKERQWMGAVAELTAAASARDEARRWHDALRKRRLDEFMAGFSIITLRLKGGWVLRGAERGPTTSRTCLYMYLRIQRCIR